MIRYHSEAVDYSIVAREEFQNTPVVGYIRDTPVTYGNIAPDFLVSPKIAIVFSSIDSYRRDPKDLTQRIELTVKGHYSVRILLFLLDSSGCESALKELHTLAFRHNFSLIVSPGLVDCARIIQLAYGQQNSGTDMIEGLRERNPKDRLVGILTQVPLVNKSDAETLIRTFGSLSAILLASKEALLDCSGIGERKCDSLLKCFGDSVYS